MIWCVRCKDIGTERGRRAWRAAWRHRRADAVGLPRAGRGAGAGAGAADRYGAAAGRRACCGSRRSELRVRVTVGGAVFWGWDGAGPTPSYAVVGGGPEPDPRAVLEPDTGRRLAGGVGAGDGGGVPARGGGGAHPGRGGAAPGAAAALVGAGARRGPGRVGAADARWRRTRGSSGWAGGRRGRGCGTATYRLWNTDPRGGFGPGDDPLYITMPVQLVVADAGTHLVFHDNSWDGRVTLREGEEGAGSGRDRPGTSELRMDGGPLRCWVLVGTPARVLQGWAALTGAAAVPPAWALGHQHARWGFGSEREVRRIVGGLPGRGICRCRRSIWTSTTTTPTGCSRWTGSASPICRGWRRSLRRATGCGWCRSSIRR